MRDSDECWEWRGTKDRYGYGRFNLDGKKEKAHRISYELHVGSISPGQMVRHKVCRNRACCNPNHLLLGTDEDNQLDKLEDGTNWRKLSYIKALEAKFLRENGASVRNIAKFFGVSTSAVYSQLSQLQGDETQSLYSERGKRITDKKEAQSSSSIPVVIVRVIG
ncbi:hypothetical protein CN428_24410 [Bacillus cereus]|nr:hypothetical protein CN428_24410 [Bacillus cereus]